MDDNQNLDDSIDSVIIGGTTLQEGGLSAAEAEDANPVELEQRVDEECESSVNFGQLKFDWTIKEFPRVWLRDSELEEDDPEEGMKLLISKNFPSQVEDDRLQFQLKIHLRGTDPEQRERPCLAVYLVYCGKDAEIRANFEIAILVKEEKRNMRNSLKICCFNEKEHPAWGFKKFIQFQRLRDEPKTYFDEDNENSLTLRCTINVVNDVGSVDMRRLMEVEQQRMAHPWTKFQADLDDLWTDAGHNSDVVFLVHGRRFHGHRVILSAGSPVMRKLFLQGCRESPNPPHSHAPPLRFSTSQTKDHRHRLQVTVSNIDPTVFEQVLRYIYTGTVDQTLDSITNLLAASNQFGLRRLKDNCEKELIVQLKNENVLEMLSLAEMQDATLLKQRALDYLNKAPPNSLDWQQLASQTPCILFDIMQIRFHQLQTRRAEDRKRKERALPDGVSFPPATPQTKRVRRQ